MKITKTMVNKAASAVTAVELFDRFLSLYEGKIIQISGPFLTLTEGHSSLPDYIVTGSIIIEEGGNTCDA